MAFKVNIHEHCKRKVNPYQDITGKTFGRLTVLFEASTHRSPCGTRRIQWFCQCECGKIIIVRGDHLRTGNTTSCGCFQIDRSTVHGFTGMPEFEAYKHARARCDPNTRIVSYQKYYVSLGVKFLFKDFEEFYVCLGPRPTTKHSVDRYPNPFGNYEPGNVRWATTSEQRLNTRKEFLKRMVPSGRGWVPVSS